MMSPSRYEQWPRSRGICWKAFRSLSLPKSSPTADVCSMLMSFISFYQALPDILTVIVFSMFVKASLSLIPWASFMVAIPIDYASGQGLEHRFRSSLTVQAMTLRSQGSYRNVVTNAYAPAPVSKRRLFCLCLWSCVSPGLSISELSDARTRGDSAIGW